MITWTKEVIAVASAIAVISCGGGGAADQTPTAPVPSAKVLTTIAVSLASSTIQLGQTTTASAAGIDQSGGAIATGNVTWSVASSAVATVSATGVLTPVAPGQTLVTASAGGKQGSATLSVIAIPASGNYRIAFARGTHCHRENPFGCDLFFTDVNLSTKTSGTVTTIASGPDTAEWFPGLSATGRFVVYNKIYTDSRGKTINEVWGADLEKKTPAVKLIADARFPQISSTDNKLYFSGSGARTSDLFVADLTLNTTTGAMSVGAVTALTSSAMGFEIAEDPFPIGATGQVVFHFEKTSSTPSAVAVLTGSSFVTVSDSSGHTSANSAGSIISSSLGGTGLSLATAKAGGWNPKQLLTLPGTASTLSSDDPRFADASVKIARWGYPEWLDDNHVISSVMGGTAGGSENVYSMSRLFLVTVAGVTYEPMATLLGGVAGDYCTVAARKLN